MNDITPIATSAPHIPNGIFERIERSENIASARVTLDPKWFKLAGRTFDLICHVAFDQPPLTRRERAESVRKRNVFTKYGLQARAVLEALLQKYQDQGVIDLGDPRILQIPPLDTMGTPVQLIKEFGTRADFMFAVKELQSALYQKEA